MPHRPLLLAICSLLWVAAAEAAAIQDLLDAQAGDGSWHADPAATAYGLLALDASQSVEAPAARRALAWLLAQPAPAGGSCRTEALLLWALAEQQGMDPAPELVARLQTGCATLRAAALEHRVLRIRVGLPERSGAPASDTAATVLALIAGRLHPTWDGRGTSESAIGAGNWFALAWTAANHETLTAEPTAPARFPQATVATTGRPVLAPDSSTDASAWGLTAAILLDHERSDLPRARLRSSLILELMPDLADQGPLEHWWSTVLAWRLQFSGDSAARCLATLHQRLAERTVTAEELPLWSFCMRLTDSARRAPALLRLRGLHSAERAPLPGEIDIQPPGEHPEGEAIPADDLRQHIEQLLRQAAADDEAAPEPEPRVEELRRQLEKLQEDVREAGP